MTDHRDAARCGILIVLASLAFVGGLGALAWVSQ